MDIKSSFDKEIFNIHSELSPLLWDKDSLLLPELRPKLLLIADEYMNFVGLPDELKVDDITLTGSLSGFNYTKYSDLDIHIIINYDNFNQDSKFAEDFFSMKRSMWSEEYNVNFYQYPIELYVQDTKQYLSGTSAQYSLIDNKWVHKPELPEGDIDETTIEKKSKDFMYLINELEDEALDNQEDYDEILEELSEIKDKIRQMRKSSIAETGEFGIGNLVFKVLRNSGYLERMTILKKKLLDKKLTIS